MSLRQLRYFQTVARLQHFRRAADHLHVAQPALTRQIAQLEQRMGVQLFERLPRGVRLTEAGEAFARDVARILAELEDATQAARRIAHGHAGILRVSFTEPGSWGGLAPNAIATFRSTEPDVHLVLLPLDSAAQLEGLMESRIDAAFLYELGEEIPDLESKLVEVGRVMIALPANHRLASADVVRLADLSGEPLIWTSPSLNPRFHEQLMAACVMGGYVPRIVQEASTLAILLSLVELAAGVGFITITSAPPVMRAVVLKPVADLTLEYRIELAWRRDNRSAALERFKAVVSSMVVVPG
jgi:DNA-binding transcriptional LysR family regulator